MCVRYSVHQLGIGTYRSIVWKEKCGPWCRYNSLVISSKTMSNRSASVVSLQWNHWNGKLEVYTWGGMGMGTELMLACTVGRWQR